MGQPKNPIVFRRQMALRTLFDDGGIVDLEGIRAYYIKKGKGNNFQYDVNLAFPERDYARLRIVVKRSDLGSLPLIGKWIIEKWLDGLVPPMFSETPPLENPPSSILPAKTPETPQKPQNEQRSDITKGSQENEVFGALPRLVRGSYVPEDPVKGG